MQFRRDELRIETVFLFFFVNFWIRNKICSSSTPTFFLLLSFQLGNVSATVLSLRKIAEGRNDTQQNCSSSVIWRFAPYYQGACIQNAEGKKSIIIHKSKRDHELNHVVSISWRTSEFDWDKEKSKKKNVSTTNQHKTASSVRPIDAKLLYAYSQWHIGHIWVGAHREMETKIGGRKSARDWCFAGAYIGLHFGKR